MATGKKYVVVVHEAAADGARVLDSVDLTGEFHYDGSYSSNNVVLRDESYTDTINHDRFIVTFYWAAGAEPNLSTKTLNALRDDAVNAVNTAYPGSIT